ncbi:MAG: glycosyltransferase family 4 protein [Phycisphaeraceae bacterium]
MNLVYSLPFWPYLYTPWLFREMQWMKQRGHHIAIVSLGDPPGPSADVKDFDLQDVPVLQVRQQVGSDKQLLGNLMRVAFSGFKGKSLDSMKELRSKSGLRQGLHEWALLKRVTAFVQKHKADAIEAHWAAHSAMLARDVYRATGIPYAVRLHGGDLYRNPSPNLPEIVADAAAACPVSGFLADLLQGERPHESLPPVPPVLVENARLHVCHNGIPGDAIGTEPAPQSDEEIVIGTIGRVDPEKRHADLIEAVARLKDTCPQLRLLIVGGGQLEPSLRALAASRGIADRVTITGPQPWNKVMELRSRFHIYAQASEVEGCSLAIAEGLGQGVPAVLSRVGAADQSVDEGINGYTFEVGDVEALCEGLRQVAMLTPSARRDMGAHSLSIIRQRFCFETLMDQLEGILGNLRKQVTGSSERPLGT